jgi:iron complex outermembrane receptor protein
MNSKPALTRGLFALLVGMSTALAQTPSDPVVVMEPVVVTEGASLDSDRTTSVRLEETLPSALQTLDNMADHVANFHINTGGAGSFGDVFTLRGLANTPYFSDPSVTLYYDDLPLGSSFTYPGGLFGFTLAVVARGPQGTSFGRSGEGGVIALISAEPGENPGGEARMSLGNFESRSVALTAHSARDAQSDATFAASYLTRAGYIENTQLGTRVDDQKASAVSARVRWRPTPASEFTLQFLGSRRRDGAQPLVPLGGPLYTVQRDRDGATASDFGGVAFKAAVETALGRLAATTSFTDWKLDPYVNELVLPPQLASRLMQTQRAWNEEIRLTSHPHDRVAWHAGVWWSESRTNGKVSRTIADVFPLEASSFTLNSHTSALFGGWDFSPADHWRISLGGRAETITKDFDRSQTVPSPGHFTDERTFSAWTPKLTAGYALSARMNASASISSGTKPGGWSAYTDSASLAPFKAERVTALEAGLDLALADKVLTLAARVFDYEVSNYQIERSFNANDYLVVNAPRARSTGAEFECAWHPVADWTLAVTLGVTDVTLREFSDPFTGANYAGKRAPYTPDYDALFNLVWRPARGWFARAEAAATGRTYYDESEDLRFAARAHTVLNLQAGYDGGPWRVSVFGRNLTDEGYYSLIVPGVGHAVPGAPRTFGVECMVRF